MIDGCPAPSPCNQLAASQPTVGPPPIGQAAPESDAPRHLDWWHGAGLGLPASGRWALTGLRGIDL